MIVLSAFWSCLGLVDNRQYQLNLSAQVWAITFNPGGSPGL